MSTESVRGVSVLGSLFHICSLDIGLAPVGLVVQLRPTVSVMKICVKVDQAKKVESGFGGHCCMDLIHPPPQSYHCPVLSTSALFYSRPSLLLASIQPYLKWQMFDIHCHVVGGLATLFGEITFITATKCIILVGQEFFQHHVSLELNHECSGLRYRVLIELRGIYDKVIKSMIQRQI